MLIDLFYSGARAIGKFRRMFCNMVHDGVEDFSRVMCEVETKAIADFYESVNSLLPESIL